MAKWINNYLMKRQLEKKYKKMERKELLINYITTQKEYYEKMIKKEKNELKLRKKIIESILELTEVIIITEKDGTLIGKTELKEKTTEELIKLFEGMIKEAEKQL